ncbi:hypothetical protein [Hyalangium sp.]|uniref:hypothetical protein n=1 Tax=Hyalangium sp. TaxID=2028555 RepID=UPI002D600ECA|nr:hypothetical protein [Hyalangium sp.]HYI00268.1 hypothetical protein [Hyalangium sp.]
MRRLLLASLVASLLGMSPLPLLSSEAWAQRSRASKSSSKGKAKKATSSKPVPKFESKTDLADTVADPVTGEAATSGSASAPPPARGPARIDFDDRLIQGQTNKSGAVYLYDRKELPTRSMIKERESFRSETLSTVYDQ